MPIILQTLTELDYIVCDSYEEAFAQASQLVGVSSLEITEVTDYTDDDDPIVTWVVSASRPVELATKTDEK